MATETETPVEPIGEGTIAPVVETEAPIVETPEVIPEVPAEPEIVPHTNTETLLEGVGKEEAPTEEKPAEPVVEVKPEDKKPEGETEKPKDETVDVKPEEKPVELEPIIYEAFKMPEGVEPDKDAIALYTDALGKHRLTQEVGQELLDLHTVSLQKYAGFVEAEQHRIFGETRSNWVTQVKADEQLGGAGHQTAMAAIARMRDKLVPADRKDAFNDFLRITGAGDHPEFLRILHNASRWLDEPTPLPASKPSPNNGQPPRRGMSAVYDHESSPKR